jgi:hypothetical protein
MILDISEQIIYDLFWVMPGQAIPTQGDGFIIWG